MSHRERALLVKNRENTGTHALRRPLVRPRSSSPAPRRQELGEALPRSRHRRRSARRADDDALVARSARAPRRIVASAGLEGHVWSPVLVLRRRPRRTTSGPPGRCSTGPAKTGARGMSGRHQARWREGLSEKYRRSAMENAGRLQCKSLRKREKGHQRKNNGKQWKNNAKSNGNRRKSRASTHIRLCGCKLMDGRGVERRNAKRPAARSSGREKDRLEFMPSLNCRKSASKSRVIPAYCRYLVASINAWCRAIRSTPGFRSAGELHRQHIVLGDAARDGAAREDDAARPL
jgi:hypothetical protein